MKTKIIIAALALATCLPPATRAQETPPPTTPGNFLQSVQGYFTTFNPALEGTFRDNKGSLWAGADFNSGAHVSSSLGLDYLVWKNFSLESVTRNADVEGTVLSQQIGAGFNVIVHDAKLTGYIDGGYNLQKSKLFCEVGIRARKALTEHTFAGLSLGVVIESKASPTVSLFTGFVF